jgi:amino acid transporter
MTREPAGLRRALGRGALIFYGVGDILGAGIYALIGTVAGVAGPRAWQSFGLAMLVASFTALSYAELVRRFPHSSGEAYYCQQAFRRPEIAVFIGWLSLASGIVSMATAARAFAGYLLPSLLGLGGIGPETWRMIAMVAFAVLVAAITWWGIRQSSLVNIGCTVAEATGLLIVIAAGVWFLARAPPDRNVVAEVTTTGEDWLAVTRGAALAFFAFIGFEDLVKVAEEAKRPERDMPIAILTALLAAGCLYVLVAWVATAVVAPAELKASRAALLTVVRVAVPHFPLWVFGVIALLAIANTGLLNFVMASRLLYGMARQGLVPRWLGEVSSQRQTPHLAIAVTLTLVLLLALSGTLGFLAGTTSVLLLLVFVSVNLSLVTVKLRDTDSGLGFRVPLAIPLTGVVASAGLVPCVPWRSLLTAAAIVAIGLVVAGVHRWAGRGGGGSGAGNAG